MKAQRGPNPWILAIGLAMLIPVVVLFAVSFGNDPRKVPFLLEGQSAPKFDLVGMDGEPVKLSDYAGRKVVINFWSTWCEPCKQEHDVLQRGPQRFPDVVFLGVVYQDEEAKVRAYLARNGSTYPHLLDPDGRMAVQYGVAGVPETYFIDEAGTIAHKQIGPVNDPLLGAVLTAALGAP